MNPGKWIWTLLFVAGGVFLFYRAAVRQEGMAKVYVTPVRVNPADPADTRNKFVDASRSEPGAVLSLPRSTGVWIAAFFTLCIFSFLYRDNVFYKLGESVMVGMPAVVPMINASGQRAIHPPRGASRQSSIPPRISGTRNDGLHGLSAGVPGKAQPRTTPGTSSVIRVATIPSQNPATMA